MVWKIFVGFFFVLTVSIQANSVDNPALFPVTHLVPENHTPISLIIDGKANFAFICDEAAEKKIRNPNKKSITNAIKILKEGFKRCAGVDVPVVDASDSKALKKYRFLFLVGESILTKKLGIKPLKLPQSGFEFKTFPGGVALVGYDASLIPDFYQKMPGAGVTFCGTRHGAVDFLERFLGCRFYYPGRLGEFWPKIKNLIIKPVNYYDYPRTNSRDNRYHIGAAFRKRGYWGKLIGETGDLNRFCYLWRQERGTMFIANHSPQPNQWLKAHPDKKNLLFYRAPNGHLYYTPSDGHGGKYLDVTNLKLADLLLEDWKKFFATQGKWQAPWTWDRPNRDYVSFGQADSSVPLPDMLNNPTVKKYGLITPEHCRHVAGQYSDIYVRFWKYLGEKLKKELPNVRLGLIPYAEYTMPPRLKGSNHLPDNVDLRVCLMQLPGRVRNPEIVREYTKLLKGWYRVQNNRPIHSLWLYNAPGNPFARSMNPRFIGEVPKAFAPYFSGKDMVYGFWFNVEWFYYYSIYPGMRALWNPDVNVDAMLEEHWKPMYGAAAPYVKAFYQLSLKSYLKYYVPSRQAHVPYPIKVLDKLQKYLKQALASVSEQSLEGRRVRLFAAPWPKAIEGMRSQLNYERSVYLVHQITAAVPTAVDWKAAPEISMMEPTGGKAKPEFATSAKMLWNKSGIFARIISHGPYLASKTKRVFDNCNIELFLSPKMNKERYYQWVISSRGQLYSGSRKMLPVAQAYNKYWKCPGLRYKVTKGNNYWSTELFIPFTGIHEKAPAAYSCWNFSLIRNKKSLPAEYSASCLTLNMNHNVEQFGFLKFLSIGD